MCGCASHMYIEIVWISKQVSRFISSLLYHVSKVITLEDETKMLLRPIKGGTDKIVSLSANLIKRKFNHKNVHSK